MNLSNLVERWQLVQAINADPALTASAKIVAVSLMGFVNSKTGECFPSFEKIAASCHRGPSQQRHTTLNAGNG